MFRLFYDAFFEVFGEVGADVLACALDCHFLHVVVDHDVDELLKRGFLAGIPAQSAFGFGRISPEIDHVSRAVEVGADLDECFTCSLVDAFLVLAFSLPAEFDACTAECEFAEFTDGVLLAGGDDEILGPVLLEDEPHTLDVVFGISPVAQRTQVAEIELVLLALCDTCGGKGYLTGDECFAASLALMVEENAGACIHIVGLAVFLDYPEAVEFSHGIGRIGMEGGILVLRYFLYLSIEFRGRCLIEAAGVAETAEADRLQTAQNAGGVDVGCEFGGIERYLYVALGGKIIEFVGAHFGDDLKDRHRVAEIRIMQVKIGMPLEMSYAFAVIDRRTTYNAMHVVSFVK